MTSRLFFTSLTLVTLLLGLIAYYLHSLPAFMQYREMSISAFVFYILWIFIIYSLSDYFSKQSLDKSYLSLIYINLMVKFAVVIGMAVFFYKYYKHPPGNFILPFLMIYIGYTIYETWLLNKMAVMRK